jgi:UDP-N-acetyl-2-amino-2-deoxyglucuronate dehydrogenase
VNAWEPTDMKNFAIIGVAGYIAGRHLKAITETGNRLVAAADPNDSVGILDRYSNDVSYFREIERFDRHVDKLRRGPAEHRIDWISVCSPNYLHDAHIRLALRNGADALCEKPIVMNPWNLDALQELELETGRRVFTVLQLRLHPQLTALRERLRTEPRSRRTAVSLVYITSRGPWYRVSWKGSVEKSGGIGTNIGIHLFDLLIWLFGKAGHSSLSVNEPARMGGELALEQADVTWFLSTDRADLPPEVREKGAPTYRLITIDGEPLEFSEGFTDLHTEVYRRMLAGHGFGIDDARPSIELVSAIRSSSITTTPPRTGPAAT